MSSSRRQHRPRAQPRMPMDLQIGFTVEMFIRIIAMGFWDRNVDVDSRVEQLAADVR